jgi:hypothetical protein
MSSLKARIERLERQRQVGSRLKRRIVFSIKDMADSDIVGMASAGGKVHLMRQREEPLSALQRRSAEIIPRFAFRVYKAPSNASEDETGAEPEVAPSAA